jgi:hypothetical protein
VPAGVFVDRALEGLGVVGDPVGLGGVRRAGDVDDEGVGGRCSVSAEGHGRAKTRMETMQWGAGEGGFPS